MAEYEVFFKASAEKELLQLPSAVLARIFPKIEKLAQNPHPPGAIKLRGAQDLWRIRVGDYRVVFSRNDSQSKIEIFRVAHRRHVYE